MNYARRYPRFWLIYFVLSVCAAAYNVVFEFLRAVSGASSPAGLLSVLFGIAALVPLYGYARQRKAGSRVFSVVVFAISSLALAAALVATLFVFLQHGFAGPVLATFVFLLFCFPYSFAAYQYCFRSPHIWQHAA